MLKSVLINKIVFLRFFSSLSYLLWAVGDQLQLKSPAEQPKYNWVSRLKTRPFIGACYANKASKS